MTPASCKDATVQGLLTPLLPACTAAALAPTLPHVTAAAWASFPAVKQKALQPLRPTCRACASRWNFLSFLFLAISLARCVFLYASAGFICRGRDGIKGLHHGSKSREMDARHHL